MISQIEDYIPMQCVISSGFFWGAGGGGGGGGILFADTNLGTKNLENSIVVSDQKFA